MPQISIREEGEPVATFFTADTHFGHKNIIAYCGRPYKTVEEMNAGLVDLWNTKVSPEDDVWILGDFAMGKIEESLRVTRLLNGKKILVVGNHDRMFGNDADAPSWQKKYYEAGFSKIYTGEVVLSVGGTDVLVSHFPYSGDSGENDRFVGERPIDNGMFLLHGHVHERWRQNARMINVGVDAWAGQPVSQQEIRQLLRSPANTLERLAWTDGQQTQHYVS